MRIEQLTFTRFVAAISIVIFHYGKGCFLFNNHYVDFIFKQANIGVSYFFILSGFVMIIAYKGKKICFFDYMKQRMARIYPIYFIGILLAFGHAVYTKEIDYWGLILNVLMLQAWVPGKALSMNVPGWSLSVEFLFYLIFPFLLNEMYSKMKTVRHYFSIIIVTIWVFTQISVYILISQNLLSGFILSSRDLEYFPLIHLNEFFVGNLAGIYFLTKNIPKRNYEIPIMGIVLLIVLVLRYPMRLDLHTGLMAVLFIPLILLIASNNGKMTIFFNSKMCIFLGEISFGIYILQYVLWQWISDYRLQTYFNLDKMEDFTLAFFIRFILLILVSSLSYVYIEKPLRKKIRQIKLSFN